MRREDLPLGHHQRRTRNHRQHPTLHRQDPPTPRTPRPRLRLPRLHPPSWCEAHHIIAWLQGGPTTVDNGVLLCGYHHRLIHQGTWTVHMAADGQPEFTPPEWISKTRKPLRNTRLRT
ncbi:HNH endonuclease signature motif containing protein [Actinopolymorpha sp. B11F2]|uniref:HNH endonuclease signature motif containing protein n=1 Tax=Actinopolymorpha sp. B11F2 TaxID=3160862 RepID=UPI0032E4AA40